MIGCSRGRAGGMHLKTLPALYLSQATARILYLRDYDPAFIVVYKVSGQNQQSISGAT